MDEYIFRKKFERAEENQLGINTSVINRILEFVNSSKKCKNEDIRFFIDNLDKIDLSYSVFNIADSEEGKEGFRYLGHRLQINDTSSDITIGHELGHVLNGIKNLEFADSSKDPLNSLKYNINTPINFINMIDKAKANCVSPEHKEDFKRFVEHICKNNTNEAEKGPLSDILSAVFENAGLRIGSYENECYFPCFHTSFFDQEMQFDKRTQSRFDECFANVFTLFANNCESELNQLTLFLGEEFMGIFLEEIHQAVQLFRKDIERNSQEKIPETGTHSYRLEQNE